MVSSLPAEYLDPATPPEVVVTDQIRPLITDSTLGVTLGAPGAGLPFVPDPPRHRLVTVGDSLTHGMSSGAVFHTDLSGPAWSHGPWEQISSSPLTGARLTDCR